MKAGEGCFQELCFRDSCTADGLLQTAQHGAIWESPAATLTYQSHKMGFMSSAFSSKWLAATCFRHLCSWNQAYPISWCVVWSLEAHLESGWLTLWRLAVGRALFVCLKYQEYANFLPCYLDHVCNTSFSVQTQQIQLLLMQALIICYHSNSRGDFFKG